MRGREVAEVRWEKIQGDLETLGCEEPGEVCGERMPCADESCIGAVGEDGCCAVCGRTGEGMEETPGADSVGPGFVATGIVATGAATCPGSFSGTV